MEIITTLEKVGLTHAQAQTYLALVKQGKSTAYKISLVAGLYKANTYQALSGLVEKGFVQQIENNQKTVYEAIPPEDILDLIERQKEELQSILPQIERSFNAEFSDVGVFEGIKPFMNLLHDLLLEKQPIYAYDIPSVVPELVRNHINQFHKKRIATKIKMYHIYDYDAKQRISYLQSLPLTYAKQNTLPRHSVVSTIVCGKQALIINWHKNIKVVRITDTDVSNAYRQQFDLLWK